MRNENLQISRKHLCLTCEKEKKLAEPLGTNIIFHNTFTIHPGRDRTSTKHQTLNISLCFLKFVISVVKQCQLQIKSHF